MARVLPLALAALTAVGTAVLAFPSSPARAEAPNARATPVYVLTLWTEDADDQADALTQTLRARVRQAPGWSLLETTQSFETLAIALKLPDPTGQLLLAAHRRPAARRPVRLGDDPEEGRGRASSPTWTCGGSWQVVGGGERKSYSDNLKDPSDEALRAVAGRLFGKLTAASAAGLLVVHAGKGYGSVLVDGVERARLQSGTARLELADGPHTVGVRVSGSRPPSRRPRSRKRLGAERDVRAADGRA